MAKNYDDVIPKNNDTAFVYRLHLRSLVNILMRLFVWENLPPNLPAEELETRLLWQGFATVFHHKTYGLVTATGSVYGQNIYSYGNKYSYSQTVLGSGNGENYINGITIYNTAADRYGGSVCRDVVKHFAKTLADIDVSITVRVINSRASNGIMAHTTAAKKTLEEYYKKLENGDYFIPCAPTAITDSYSQMIQHDVSRADKITDLLTLKSQIMRDFYAYFGIQTVQHKNERLIADEINSDTDFLSANIQDLLAQRQRGAKAINDLFGTNISVGVRDYVS